MPQFDKLHIFICYGGSNAEHTAEKLNNFLRTETDMNTDFVSPLSNTVVANDHTVFETARKLKICDIAIFVCHKETPESKALIKEIDIMTSQNMTNKIIFFSASDECLPKKVKKEFWRPLHFAPEKVEESFCRLTNHIYRSFIKNNYKKQIPISPENAEMPLQ